MQWMLMLTSARLIVLERYGNVTFLANHNCYSEALEVI